MRFSARWVALMGTVVSLPALAQAPGGAKSTELPLSCNAAAKAAALKSRETGVNATEVRTLLKQALAADPNCAMAKAWLYRELTGGTRDES